MSATIATIGVAMKGKPNPSAPWIRPASNTAITTHSITASENDSNPGMAIIKNFATQRQKLVVPAKAGTQVSHSGFPPSRERRDRAESLPRTYVILDDSLRNGIGIGRGMAAG